MQAAWALLQTRREMYLNDPTNQSLGALYDRALDDYVNISKRELPYLCMHK